MLERLMELTHLRHFYLVATTKSFTRGAQIACVSPPAISKTIRKLEEELGTALLQRTTRRVALTESGEILLRRCREVFDLVDGIRHDLDEAQATVSGELRIAAMEVFSVYLLPLALTNLVAQHPRLVPRTYEMLPDLMERHLAEGALDVGFTVGGGASDEVVYETLGTSPGVVVCGRGHARYRSGMVTPEKLDDAFVVPRFFQREYLPPIDQFPDDRVHRKTGASIELMQMGIQLVLEGTYLGYFPEVSVRQHLRSGAMRALEGVPSGRPFELRALLRRGTRPRASAAALIAEVRGVLQTPPRQERLRKRARGAG